MKKRISMVLAISMVMSVLFLSAFSAGAESILDTAISWETGKSKTVYLDGKGENDFKVTLKRKGVLKVSINSYAYGTGIYLYDSNGSSINPIKNEAESGSWNGYNWLYWNKTIEQSKGYKSYNLDKGTYYIRLYTDKQYQGEKCTISTSFTSTDSKAPTDAFLTVSLKKGDTLKLGTALSPSGSTGTTTWTTSKKEIATVSKKGTVTAKAKGSTTITATVNEIKLKIIVKVAE